MSELNLFLEPPEEILNIEAESYDATWAVIGSNSRVVKNWRELVLSCRRKCYSLLPISISKSHAKDKLSILSIA